MTVTARKYNPGFLTDNELVASFCVRTDEFESMVEALRQCTGNANTHQIVIGPRGSGKTTLLLRVAAEIRRNKQLSSLFFPVVFSEESYEVSTAGEFWLECLSRLADQTPRRKDRPDLRLSFEDLRRIRDDRTLRERCLGVLQDFADWEDKRLVLIVENLNMLLGDIGDEDTGWQLRHTLQTEPRILLLASATSRFDEIDNPHKALYDLFRVCSLRPLDKDDCATLWQAVSSQQRALGTIQALRILTGGSPRLLTILARFGANLSLRELMADLLNLVDDHTEYFKSHLDGLPAQERRVYLALLGLWKPVTAREVADRARVDTNKCSAYLKRLTKRGVVVVAGGTERRKLYYVTERLYNIYYLMRRARGRDSLIEALVRFMEALYSPSELKDLVSRTVREAMGLEGEAKWMHRIAFDRLLESPSLSVHREELSALTSWIHPFAPGDAGTAKVLFSRALEIARRGHESEAITLWDEVVRRLETSNAAEDLQTFGAALHNKGTALVGLNRLEEALEVWDEILERFGASDSPRVFPMVARAVVGKGSLNRPEEVLGLWDATFRRAAYSDNHTVDHPFTAEFLPYKSMVLDAVEQKDEGSAFRDEAVQRLCECDESRLVLASVEAMARVGAWLIDQNRFQAALSINDEMVRRYGSTDTPIIRDAIALVFANTGESLLQMNRPVKALAAWEDAARHFGSSDTATTSVSVARFLVRRGSLLADLNRPQDALKAMDEVIQRFGSTTTEPSLETAVSAALLGKARALTSLNRLREAVAAYDEVLNRSSVGTTLESQGPVAGAMVAKGAVLVGLNRPEAALTTWEEVVRRFGTSDQPNLQHAANFAQLKSAELHLEMGRSDVSVAAADRVFEPESPKSPGIRCQCHLTRARAHLLEGDKAACVLDIETALSILSELGSLPQEILNGLCWLAVELGPAQLRELIVASPASSMLFPLTTALERELGIETRVAKEVGEVAEDVQRDLEKRRKYGGTSPSSRLRPGSR